MESSDSSSDSSPTSDRYSYDPVLCWNPQVEQYFAEAYGSDHFARISKALTHPSSYSCVRVNSLKSTTDVVIEKLYSVLQIKRLSRNLNSTEPGHPEEYNRDTSSDVCIEESIELAKRRGIPTKEVEPIYKCHVTGIDNVLFVQGSGPHVLKYNDENGKPLKEIIVSRKCAEAVLRGAQVFVPGVLACSLHVERGDKVALAVAVEQLESDNNWALGITRGMVLHGSQTDPHYEKRKGMYIGQGNAMMSRAGMFRENTGVAVDMTDRIYQLPSFHNVLEGEIFLQNFPSIIAARVLDPHEGERILDMCAAPGGKTTAIAILMRDKGEIVAIDRSHNKVTDILNLAAEMGLTCISAFKLDALKAVSKNHNLNVKDSDLKIESLCNTVTDRNIKDVISGMPVNAEKCNFNQIRDEDESNQAPFRCCTGEDDGSKLVHQRKNGRGRSNVKGSRVEISKGFPPHTFDRVLLDAPCSALGLRPKLFSGEETLESLRKHATYQKRMFDQAVQLVRPGGVIVYSTFTHSIMLEDSLHTGIIPCLDAVIDNVECTINPGENEAIVRYALDTYKFLSLAPQHPRVGGPGLVGSYKFPDGKMVKWLNPWEAELVQRFDPSSSLDTIGFFIAKFDVGQTD